MKKFINHYTINRFFEGFLLILSLTFFGKEISFFYLGLFIFIQLFRFFNKYLKLSENYVSILILSVYLSFFGDWELYYYFPYYDKVLHFINPLIATVVWIKIVKLKSGFFGYLSSYAILGFGAVFELIEFFWDKILDTAMMGVYTASFMPIMPKLDDTMFDLLFGFVGVNAGYLISRRKNVWKKIF